MNSRIYLRVCFACIKLISNLFKFVSIATTDYCVRRGFWGGGGKGEGCCTTVRDVPLEYGIICEIMRRLGGLDQMTRVLCTCTP
jgi:hypothetical protein